MENKCGTPRPWGRSGTSPGGLLRIFRLGLATSGVAALLEELPLALPEHSRLAGVALEEGLHRRRLRQEDDREQEQQEPPVVQVGGDGPGHGRAGLLEADRVDLVRREVRVEAQDVYGPHHGEQDGVRREHGEPHLGAELQVFVLGLVDVPRDHAPHDDQGSHEEEEVDLRGGPAHEVGRDDQQHGEGEHPERKGRVDPVREVVLLAGQRRSRRNEADGVQVAVAPGQHSLEDEQGHSHVPCRGGVEADAEVVVAHSVLQGVLLDDLWIEEKR
mmetsp:Transcript_74819/g.198775  ORF Transcript_74819/g.198775 Transcript_74819/m.198775 type:complete len:273 (-) Transcript_74819:223-1041(-)